MLTKRAVFGLLALANYTFLAILNVLIKPTVKVKIFNKIGVLSKNCILLRRQDTVKNFKNTLT